MFSSFLRYKDPAIAASEIIQSLSAIDNIQDIYVTFAWLPPGKSNYVVRYIPNS